MYVSPIAFSKDKAGSSGKGKGNTKPLEEGISKEISENVRILKTGNLNGRVEAAFELGELRDKSAVKPLIEAMEDDEPEVREYVVEALGKIRDKEALSVLVEALDDTTEIVLKAIDALGEMGDISVIFSLEGLSHDPDEDVRKRAKDAIGRIRDEAKRARKSESDAKFEMSKGMTIKEIFESGDPELRSFIIDCEPHRDCVPSDFIEFLDSEDSKVRKDAVAAINLVAKGGKDESMVPILLKHLNDPDESVLESVIILLGDIGSVSALPALIELWNEVQDEHLKEEITISVHNIDPVAALPMLIAYHSIEDIEREDLTKRSEMEFSIGDIGERAIHGLVYFANNADQELRAKSIILLLKNKPELAYQVLREHVRHEDSTFRKDAMSILENMIENNRYVDNLDGEALADILTHSLGGNDEEQIQKSNHMLQTLRQSDETIWHQFVVNAEYLDTQNDSDTAMFTKSVALTNLVNSLHGYLEEGEDMWHPDILSSEIALLGSIGNERHIPTLSGFLGSHFEEVTASAIKAIGDIGGPVADEVLQRYLSETNVENAILLEELAIALSKTADTDSVYQILYSRRKTEREVAAKAIRYQVKRLKTLDEMQEFLVYWDAEMVGTKPESADDLEVGELDALQREIFGLAVDREQMIRISKFDYYK